MAMNDALVGDAPAIRSPWVTLALPLLLLAGLVVGLTAWDATTMLGDAAPPAEEVVFDRIQLSEGQIVLHVRNAVSAPVSIAQVLVDDAFWQFEAHPSADLGRYGTATITIDYPWVEGEPHVVGVVTNTGLVWDHEIVVATATPVPEPRSLMNYAWIGILVGLVPVAIGMAFYPAMRAAPERIVAALLALTLGLLAYLAVDTVGEGLELAEGLSGALSGLGIFLGAALVAALGVLGLERGLRRAGAGPFALALLVALGIGLHNLGEGLLIGSAFALGSLALGSALIMGFALHNVTEGPAIVAPLLAKGERKIGLNALRFSVLAAVGGLPTVLGAWLGAFTTTGLLAVVFFGLGAGAIVVVLVQVGGALKREGSLVTPLTVGAFVVGYAIMLLTGYLTG